MQGFIRKSLFLVGMFAIVSSQYIVPECHGQTTTQSATQQLTALSPTVSQAELKAAVDAVSELKLTELIEALEGASLRYAQQLQSLTRSRLVEEQEFIARVALLVQQEKLPKQLVDSAWLWVRTKRRGTPFPFIYFERILRLQAAKTNFLLPEFDRAIYSARGIRSFGSLKQ